MQKLQGQQCSAAKVLAIAWVLCTASGPALAQTAAPAGAAPSAEQMIEQLKAPRTRSLRNLSVEPVNTEKR